MKKVTSIIGISLIVGMIILVAACGNSTPRERRTHQQVINTDSINERQQYIADSIAWVTDSLNRAIREAKVDDMLNSMDLSKLGIPINWSGAKVVNASQYLSPENNALDGGVRYAIIGATDEETYGVMKKGFNEKPGLWMTVFTAVSPIVKGIKEFLVLPDIDTTIVPYLYNKGFTDGYKSNYNSVFEKFYQVQIKEDSGVWYSPHWEKFEQDFFKSFPTAFGRASIPSKTAAEDIQEEYTTSVYTSSSAFGQSYKRWLTVRKISPAAKSKLAEGIIKYNNL